MIFLNRRRTPLKQEATKDPSKYWYVEKYVYGVLKETVEIPLGTGTKFTAIESGYDDDTFYNWSIDSTITTPKFNATSTYKNTTAIVKKYLDSENTLKIYAVYSYDFANLFNYKEFSAVGNDVNCALYTIQDAVISFCGYQYTNSTSKVGYDAVEVKIQPPNGTTVTFEVETHDGYNFMTNTIDKTITEGSKITFTLYASRWSSQTGGGETTSYMKIKDKSGNSSFYTLAKKYRVERHT